jgi:hypothetical protein
MGKIVAKLHRGPLGEVCRGCQLSVERFRLKEQREEP